MHRFSNPVSIGEDAATSLPVLGFVLNEMFIHDPAFSECGRFEVDALATYGVPAADVRQLKQLNDLVDAATQAALNAGCREVQDALGVTAGDLAGVHFSGSAAVQPVAKAMCEYILAEYLANADVALADESPRS